MSNSVWDMLMGNAERVSLMAPGPVRSERSDGLLSAVTEPLQYAPGPLGVVAGIGNAIANGETGLGLLSGAALKSAPIVRNVVVPAKRLPNATHTWTGADGMLRANTDDRFARMLNGGILSMGKPSAPLGEVFKHDELFKMYPDLKNVKVMPLTKAVAGAAGADARAAYDKVNDVIFVNPKLTVNEQADAIIHELNHAVQKREKMPGGANSAMAKKAYGNMLDQYRLEKDLDAKAAERTARLAKKKYGIDFEGDFDRQAGKLYRMQQGEADAFSSQEVYKIQQRQREALGKEDFSNIPQPELNYKQHGMYEPVLWKDMARGIFGYDINLGLDDFVDATTNGVKGGSVSDSKLKKLLGL